MGLNIRALFMDPDLRAQHIALGPGVLRGAAKAAAMPPPAGLRGPGLGVPDGAPEAPPMRDGEGNICGEVFGSMRALLAHQ
eukprot:4729943-Pyramimonas_sp.AAC.1